MLDRLINSIKQSAAVQNTYRTLLRLFDWFYENAFWGLCKKFDRKFIKFLFVGFLNTMFGYFCYAVLVTFNLPYSTALLISYFLGVLWNFKTTGSIVFKNSDNTLIFKFFLSYVFSYFVNLQGLHALTRFGLNKYLAQAILVLPIALLSFMIFKTFVFNDKKSVSKVQEQ